MCLEIDILSELIQISLGTLDRFSRVPNDYEWSELLKEAQKHAIVGVLFDGLERLPNDQLPQKNLLLEWVGITQMVERTHTLHCKRSRELANQVLNAGFSSCVLKGISIAKYYPNPERRQCGDIDLWVDGPRNKVMAWVNHFKIDHLVWHNVGVQLFSDVPVEIHFHPCWLYNPIYNRRIQQWFEQEKQKVMRNFDDILGISIPTITFNVVYSLLHTFRHFITEGIGLRHVVDYYYIVRSLSEKDKEEIVGLIRYFGLTKFTRGMMWVLGDVCGMPKESFLLESNEQEGRFIIEEIVNGGNFGHYKNKQSLFMRIWTMLFHYPTEIIWIVQWKFWHWCWRKHNA